MPEDLAESTSYGAQGAGANGLRAALDLATVIDRRDFGFDWQMELPNGGDALAYDVTVEVTFVLVQPEG